MKKYFLALFLVGCSIPSTGLCIMHDRLTKVSTAAGAVAVPLLCMAEGCTITGASLGGLLVGLGVYVFGYPFTVEYKMSCANDMINSMQESLLLNVRLDGHDDAVQKIMFLYLTDHPTYPLVSAYQEANRLHTVANDTITLLHNIGCETNKYDAQRYALTLQAMEYLNQYNNIVFLLSESPAYHLQLQDYNVEKRHKETLLNQEKYYQQLLYNQEKHHQEIISIIRDR